MSSELVRFLVSCYTALSNSSYCPFIPFNSSSVSTARSLYALYTISNDSSKYLRNPLARYIAVLIDVALFCQLILLPGILLRLRVLEELLVRALRLKVGVLDFNILYVGSESSCIPKLVGYSSIFEKVCRRNSIQNRYVVFLNISCKRWYQCFH